MHSRYLFHLNIQRQLNNTRKYQINVLYNDNKTSKFFVKIKRKNRREMDLWWEEDWVEKGLPVEHL